MHPCRTAAIAVCVPSLATSVCFVEGPPAAIRMPPGENEKPRCTTSARAEAVRNDAAQRPYQRIDNALRGLVIAGYYRIAVTRIYDGAWPRDDLHRSEGPVRVVHFLRRHRLEQIDDC